MSKAKMKYINKLYKDIRAGNVYCEFADCDEKATDIFTENNGRFSPVCDDDYNRMSRYTLENFD